MVLLRVALDQGSQVVLQDSLFVYLKRKGTTLMCMEKMVRSEERRVGKECRSRWMEKMVLQMGLGDFGSGNMV